MICSMWWPFATLFLMISNIDWKCHKAKTIMDDIHLTTCECVQPSSHELFLHHFIVSILKPILFSLVLFHIKFLKGLFKIFFPSVHLDNKDGEHLLAKSNLSCKDLFFSRIYSFQNERGARIFSEDLIKLIIAKKTLVYVLSNADLLFYKDLWMKDRRFLNLSENVKSFLLSTAQMTWKRFIFFKIHFSVKFYIGFIMLESNIQNWFIFYQ